MRPTLIVVTGRPGAGKSTLVRDLARAIRCPAICRDEIKEGLLNTYAGRPEPDDAGRQVYETFFATLELLLKRGVSVVAEAAFQHKLWAPKLEPLREIADLRIVVCTVDAAVAYSRRVERGLADTERFRFHPDTVAQAAGAIPPAEMYDPPHLKVPTLEIDTTNGYRPNWETIVAFARGTN